VVSNGVKTQNFSNCIFIYVIEFVFGGSEVIFWVKFHVGSNGWGQMGSKPKNFQIASISMLLSLFLGVLKTFEGSNSMWGQIGGAKTRNFSTFIVIYEYFGSCRGMIQPLGQHNLCTYTT